MKFRNLFLRLSLFLSVGVLNSSSVGVDNLRYQSPLSGRYASDEMNYLFSPQSKYSSWRKVWVALAKAEKDLGLEITEKQIEELEKHVDDVDFDIAARYEKELKHDVMAHIHAYADQCPSAAPIIHLGATSCLITDNADLIVIREALKSLQKKLVILIKQLSDNAIEHKDLACLAFTHFQSAQPTTVGKRVCLWAQDFLLDLNDLNYRLETMQFLGIKGATGTQASFLKLFDGDHEKVKGLEKKVAQYLDIKHIFPISGQTYTRKQDAQILDVLSGVATSAHKMATDIRLLAHLKEVEEPFGQNQVGSSAMPYKRNPMKCERICGLARLIIANSDNPKYTAATQWFERTLDDSANRRFSISESFLLVDSILNLLISITDGMVVYPKVIEKHLEKELPFLATENILMEAVKNGGDRQFIHEKIRKHSVEISNNIKNSGIEKNDLLERIANDIEIPLEIEEIEKILDVTNFIGRAPQQVEEFIDEYINPIIKTFDVDFQDKVEVIV